MLKRCFPVALLALACAPALVVSALEPKALNPFDTIDRAQVLVFVGEPIGNARGRRLFADDAARIEGFCEQLKDRIEGALRASGYQPDQNADDLVGVGIWGQQVPRADGRIENVFLIELTVVDHDWNPTASADCERDLEQYSRAVGVASDDRLELELTAESIRLLQELLPKARV